MYIGDRHVITQLRASILRRVFPFDVSFIINYIKNLHDVLDYCEDGLHNKSKMLLFVVCMGNACGSFSLFFIL